MPFRRSQGKLEKRKVMTNTRVEIILKGIADIKHRPSYPQKMIRPMRG
jgi:hypothetical protein